MITWKFHIDEKSKSSQVPYDMILGLDFLTELEIILDFETNTIKWGENQMEMLPQNTVKNDEMFQEIFQMSQEPTILQQAEERQSWILEADYSKVDMKSFIHSLDYLDSKEKNELLSTVKQFPNLFSGGLGKLQIKPIRLELKDGFKPYHAIPYGIPQAYLQT